MVELSTIDLRSNPITEIEFDSFGNQETGLLVNSTQFLCDCNMFWFAQWLQDRGDNRRQSDLPRCHHPLPLKGVSLYDIDVQQLRCDSNPRPTIISHPESDSAQVGSVAKFVCSARTTEIESVEIEWLYQEEENSAAKVLEELDGLVTIAHSRPSSSQSGNTVGSVLTLRDLDTRAIGYYKCSIRNRYGHVQSDLGHLNVHQLPGFSKRPRNETVAIDEKVRLTCDAKGFPEPDIIWTRDAGHNFMSEWKGRVELSNDDRSLTIDAVNAKDTGKYTCIAINSAGNVTADVFIKMAPSDTLISFDKNVKYEKGVDVVLKCNYPQIFPPVFVKWYFNNSELVESDRHFFTENEHVLVIDSARDSDSGLYQCKIYNELGSASGVTKLVVGPEGDGAPGEMPYWVWIIGVAVGAIFVTSLVWLVVFCRTRVRRGENSDLGTEETNLQSNLLERHLNDNQKHAQRLQAFNSRAQGDIIRNYERSTPMTASSQSEKDTLLAGGAQTPNSAKFFQKPVPDFGSMYHQLHQQQMAYSYSPYHQGHLTPQFGHSPFLLPQTPKFEMPYRPPFMAAGPAVWTPRAATMPDLDEKYQEQPPPPRFPPMDHSFRFPPTPTRSVHNFPHFMKCDMDLVQTSAPGPDRNRRKGRRSEPAKLNFAPTTPIKVPPMTPKRSQKPQVKLKDDEGIVQRLLGPIESTPPKMSTQSVDKEHYKKERRKTEH